VLCRTPAREQQLHEDLAAAPLPVPVEGGLSVVILAIFLDRVTGGLGTRRPRARRLSLRPSRRRAEAPDREPEVVGAA
jgi:hypothetical protein